MGMQQCTCCGRVYLHLISSCWMPDANEDTEANKPRRKKRKVGPKSSPAFEGSGGIDTDVPVPQELCALLGLDEDNTAAERANSGARVRNVGHMDGMAVCMFIFVCVCECARACTPSHFDAIL